MWGQEEPGGKRYLNKRLRNMLCTLSEAHSRHSENAGSLQAPRGPFIAKTLWTQA